MYYNAKVKVATDGPKGDVKWVTETYLVEAESVTHAEAQVHKDFAQDSVDFEVVSISTSKVIKVIV
jgi:hypothetical protein